MDFEQKEQLELKDFTACLNYLQSVIEPISNRFTKYYLQSIESEITYLIPVEFCEPSYKRPIPIHKVKLLFKVPRTLEPHLLEFQIENELTFFPFSKSINQQYFESLIDKIYNLKCKASEALMLHTTFESTRLTDQHGEKVKLFTIEDDENLFSNNFSEHFFYTEKLEFGSLEELDVMIKSLWKALSANNAEQSFITITDFNHIFTYSELNLYSREHIDKLWKYSSTLGKETLTYQEFVIFAVDLIHCRKAFYISQHKEMSNPYIINKINKAVEVMNQHFKEMDYEENNEISYKDLKDCLSKENELFSRKEIEQILKQINPSKKFEYWKFDKILKILYYDYFDYNKLKKEDKIYKYLIEIFTSVDFEQKGLLKYDKMRYALLIEDKLKLNKSQILMILNLFDINSNIDYYKASLLIRNIIQELFDPEVAIQKLDILDVKFQSFNNFEDKYDEAYKQVISLFTSYDEDLDHLLSKDEFFKFLNYLIPYLKENDKKMIFDFTNESKSGKVNFIEFKASFNRICLIGRIKDLFKTISTLKIIEE
jgi:Ca2+-binding EF-hand superfamily protein